MLRTDWAEVPEPVEVEVAVELVVEPELELEVEVAELELVVVDVLLGDDEHAPSRTAPPIRSTPRALPAGRYLDIKDMKVSPEKRAHGPRLLT